VYNWRKVLFEELKQVEAQLVVIQTLAGGLEHRTHV
jgi:hypothetical protein